jgi:hypothetical protein
MNAGDFYVLGTDAGPDLWCPICEKILDFLPGEPTIRELIRAASDHARTAHPVAARYGYACRGINETGY